jgi:hypothetical protein
MDASNDSRGLLQGEDSRFLNPKEWIVDVPNFRWYCFCETPDDWYPTCGGVVKLTVVKLLKTYDRQKEGVRICIWGGDDFGLEKDLDIPFDAAIVQADLIPVPITQAWLRTHGYVQA